MGGETWREYECTPPRHNAPANKLAEIRIPADESASYTRASLRDGGGTDFRVPADESAGYARASLRDEDGGGNAMPPTQG